MNSRTLIILSLLLIFICPITLFAANHVPVVKNVYAQQRHGTFLIEITYDVEDADGDLLEITVEASDDDGETYTIIPQSLTGDVGGDITPGAGKLIVWNVGKDLPDTNADNFKVRVIADDGGPEGMVLIPAGWFSMGDHHDVGDSDEKPVHTVYIDAFYMDVYEVTNAQYEQFMDATGHRPPAFWDDPDFNQPNHPVVGVSWHDAVAYAEWAGKRLPTEAEWEKAARGGLVGNKYPNGDSITHDDANYSGTGGRDIWTYTSPVGSFPPNGYGLYDMAGNVWELCSDWYDANYYSVSPPNNPKGPNSGTYRVLRGGSWSFNAYYLRCAFRNWIVAYGTLNFVGFRCSQDQ